MVDAVVSFVVQKLGDYLIQEAVFLGGVKDEMQLLKNELEWMQCFIKDAEEKQVEDAMIRKWVSDIRDIAYDIEDVLDTFMLNVTLKRRAGIFASIMKCSCIYSKGEEVVNLHSIGKEIEALRRRINDLSRIRELYGLQNIDNNREEKRNALGKLKQLRRASSFAVEENIVGFEDDARVMSDKLLEKDTRRIVISIFGMGGLGKTTLAKKLYHHNDVKNNFDYCAWVSVSQDYITRDLLLRIIESFKIKTIETTEKLQMMNEENLERYLHESLQGHSYLVVIDDVWQKEAWESLKRALPDNRNSSRVIITTRIKEVAEHTNEKTYVHRLRYLRPDESWKLFCEKAFQNVNADEGLKELGKEMVEKCGGLPLAIVVLGGLLSTKKPQEWHVVRDHIWRHLKDDSIHIKYLLALSFNDLPYQLKMCFLYLGLFPEDCEIKVEKLIQLLVAEGFIREDEDLTMEEVAQNNLNMLIDRSLLQIEKICWGRITTCRVHDLLRDLAIEKAKELNFIHICDERRHSSTSSSIMSSSRQQAIYSGADKRMWLQSCNSQSRSLLFFNQKWDESLKIRQHLTPLCTRFRLLRVLDVQGPDRCGNLPEKSLPEAIGKLIHLKYLGLRGAYIYNFPSSIVNLQRLQTLDLYGVEWFLQQPTEIGELRQLRHLLGKFEGTLSIDNLTNLQTLDCVNYESWTTINPEKLINLRELYISGYSSEDSNLIITFDSFAKLKRLRSLTVDVHRAYFSSLHPLFDCRYLKSLTLTGKIQILPGDMHELLPNLECLSLKNSQLEDDPMLILEKLPNLTILQLGYDFYRGKQLICKAEGFARLEILHICLSAEQEWQVSEEAMPTLRGLSIPETFKLRIPLRFRSIPPPAVWECLEYIYLRHYPDLGTF